MSLIVHNNKINYDHYWFMAYIYPNMLSIYLYIAYLAILFTDLATFVVPY